MVEKDNPNEAFHPNRFSQAEQRSLLAVGMTHSLQNLKTNLPVNERKRVMIILETQYQTCGDFLTDAIGDEFLSRIERQIDMFCQREWLNIPGSLSSELDEIIDDSIPEELRMEIREFSETAPTTQPTADMYREEVEPEFLPLLDLYMQCHELLVRDDIEQIYDDEE